MPYPPTAEPHRHSEKKGSPRSCRVGPDRYRAVLGVVACTAILSFSSPAQAFYKCKEASGSIAFSDKPCESAAPGSQAKKSENTLRLDASSEASLTASKERIAEALPQAQRKAFDTAITSLLISELALHPDKSQLEIEAIYRSNIDGKTAKEIIAMAESIQSDPIVQKALHKEQQHAEQ